MADAIGISELTIGIDRNGMETYKDSLKAELLVSTRQRIEDITAIESAINQGWQGVSKDKFMDKFKTLRERVSDDLEREYKDLEYRLDELVSNYFQQDKKMID